VALGIRPVLVERASTMDGSAGYLDDRLNGVAVVRRGGGISLEAVLAAHPDLIFAGSIQDGRLYGQLSQIAPTILLASAVDGYRENRILDVGAVLGMSDQARRRLAEYRKYVDDARQVLAAQAGPKSIAFLRFRRNTCVIYTQTATFGPLLFGQLGLTPDPAVPMVMSPGGWDVLSVERLSTLRAEHIFMVVDRDSDTYLQGVANTSIWRDIPAARHDHVHRVASSTWIDGDGLLGCEAIVNDVLAAMGPEPNR
jgi:iron complex transport system substrate-binding protein